MRGWILACALALAACGREGQTGAAPSAPSAPAMEAAVDSMARTQGGAQKDEAAPPIQNGAEGPAPISYLAYAYSMGLEVPAGRLIGLMDAHANACRAAGPRLCQLIGASREGDPEASLYGQLSLRGEPAWLQRFMAGISSDTENAGGKIKSQGTTTEDLTRSIIDTQAALRAKTALRDRVQRILESRPGRLADLLEAERELARVQGEIDATQSELAAMRTRVSMSALTIAYQSAPRPLASDTFEPLARALAGFLGTMTQGLAMIITLIAALIPWALLAAAIAWIALWLRKRRGGRLLPRKQPPAPPPPAP
ncbi:MAG: DUF4349 domain-containing protein [Hyphomonadaceae bacterium]